MWKHCAGSSFCMLQAVSPIPMKVGLGRVEEPLWEKEKMLVTSIFSFFHNVYKSPLCQCRLKSGFCCKDFSNCYISMGECNTIQSAYTKYRHLGLCCIHPLKNFAILFFSSPELKVLMVSFCDRPVSGVCRALSTISLNIFSS